MNAMIFQSWSEVLMAAPIGGIGAWTTALAPSRRVRAAGMTKDFPQYNSFQPRVITTPHHLAT
jgi:hypothetical protein